MAPWRGVVLLLAATACGPTAPTVGLETAAVASAPPPRSPRGGERAAYLRQVVVGQMCPASAGGRPGIEPWFTRQLSWIDDPELAATPIGRGAARQFSVLGFDGRRVGLFSAIGLAEIDGGPIAAGGYAGASPCSKATPPGSAEELDPGCARLQLECGVAVAEIKVTALAPVGEDPEPLAVEVGGACVAGDGLAIDVDGDGRAERFPLAGLVDETSGPAAEWIAGPRGEATCTPTFSIPELLPKVHPRGFLGLDLLAVLDADGDGRKEVVVQLRYAGRRSVAIYAARENASRFELSGEAVIRDPSAVPTAPPPSGGGDGAKKPKLRGGK